MSLKKIFKESYTGRKEFPQDFKCPKPEDVMLGEAYAFTLNPAEQPYCLMTHAKVVQFYDELKECMLKMHGCEITMHPELSVKQRLHFHGYIKITDKMLFYFHDITVLNNYGNIDIEKINDPLIWDLYVYKNRDMMADYFTFINAKHLHMYNISSVDIQLKAI